MTTASPSTVGSVATRMSSIRPAAAAFSEIRPSCGLRRSAMSSFASTFRRVVTPAAIRFGMRCTSCRTPSMRSRTTSASSCGSKWMSLAPSSAAWKMIELTSRTSGASEMPSSASRSSASSSGSATARPPRRPPPGRRTPRRRAQGGEARSRCPRARRRRARAGSAWRAAARRSPWTLPGSATATRSDVALERVRQGDRRAPARGAGQLPAASSSTPGQRQVDERQVVAAGERARDALAGGDALVEQRLREGAALLDPAADARRACPPRSGRSPRAGRRRAPRPR